MTTTARRWVLRRRPVGPLRETDLELVTDDLREPSDGEVLVRVVYLSLDPTHRLWVSDQDQYMPPVRIGETLRAGAACVVERSASPLFAPGDIVKGHAGWGTHAVLPAASVTRIDIPPGLPLTAMMSVLGTTGLTAWFGMRDIGRPKAGETVVVSAAAGAVGSVAAQIAKLKGARVIGIAGGPEKCAWLKDDLGLDGVIDYKSEDVAEALDRLCPGGIDVDFENVGGPVMDAVYSRLRDFGRMVLCGLISGYNASGGFTGPSDFGRILMHKLTIRGFIFGDFLDRVDEAMAELVPWVRDGRIRYRVHIDQGLENAPASLERLFSGNHTGKLLLQLSPEP